MKIASLPPSLPPSYHQHEGITLAPNLQREGITLAPKLTSEITNHYRKELSQPLVKYLQDLERNYPKLPLTIGYDKYTGENGRVTLQLTHTTDSEKVRKELMKSSPSLVSIILPQGSVKEMKEAIGYHWDTIYKRVINPPVGQLHDTQRELARIKETHQPKREGNFIQRLWKLLT